MNACVASGIAAQEMAASFDSVWIDFTKGLGAPLGAVLAGSAAFIDDAWRWKQRLGGSMRQAGISSRALSALNIEQVVEPYIRGKAIRYLEEGKIVIFAAGTGNPFFTTDTAAALRGSEMGAEIVIKATKVDGVYTADPQRDPRAQRYTRISFDEAIVKNLKVMDATALTLCRDQKLPINVFSIFKKDALRRVVLGEDEGTLVHV